jgi:hypothetical protein
MTLDDLIENAHALACARLLWKIARNADGSCAGLNPQKGIDLVEGRWMNLLGAPTVN